MNGYQRITAALRGGPLDATPVMLHNFMLAAREAGLTMREFRSSPRQIARTFSESVARYGQDGILVDIDTATLAAAVGVPVAYPEDEPAVCRGARLSSLAEVDALPPPDVAKFEGVQVWLEAVRLLKREFDGEIFIRGNCDQAPFSLASLMRGAEDWMLDLMEPDNEPAAFRLLDYCYEAGTQFLRLMAATGCDMLSNGDSSAGSSLISPRMHRKFAHSYETRLASFSHELGLPYAQHVCGNARPILADLSRYRRGRDRTRLQDRFAKRARRAARPRHVDRQHRSDRRHAAGHAGTGRVQVPGAEGYLLGHDAADSECGLCPALFDAAGESARDDSCRARRVIGNPCDPRAGRILMLVRHSS